MSALSAEVGIVRRDTYAWCCERARFEVLRRASALRVDSNDVGAWYALGVALLTLGDRMGALLALRNALARNASHLPSQLALGRLLFDCGQVEHALQCFERANAIPS